MNRASLGAIVIIVIILLSLNALSSLEKVIKVSDISVAAASTSLNSFAVTWNKTYTENNMIEVDSVVQAHDEGYLLGGTSRVGSEIVILKVDSGGDLLWNKTYDGVGNHLSKWLIPTADGNYAIAGQYQGGFWIAKIDSDGNMLWNNTFVGNGFSWATTLTQTSDGGYALIGQTGSSLGQTQSSSLDAMGVIWLLKTDSLGNEQWNVTLGQGVAWSVIQNSEDGFAIAGTLGSSLPDWLALTTDSTGNMLWNKTYGSQDDDVCYSIEQTSDGGYALGGWMWLRSNGGGPNQAIVKTDALGSVQWTKYFGSGFARYMTSTGDGAFLLVGTKLTKVDASGNQQWEVSLQTNATFTEGYSVIETQDGGYLVAGYGGNMNGWLAKIASNSIASTSEPTSINTKPSVSTTLAIPELSWLTIVPFLLSMFSIAVLLRNRKTTNLSN